MHRVLFTLALAAACTTVYANAAICRAPHGSHITLFGGVDDPDVLVWDSKDRLVRYAAGSVDARRFLLPHALLNRPGTRATIVSCASAAVHPKFSAEDADAVGVIIDSGRYKGRYGWVSSADVHGLGVQEARDTW